ncbi:hypothetical protein HPB52_023051 [Rhipicephalus sanguineus]|uniref:Gustatory receptor n=1 Tax=Rhipicephalus sanguineus TaxID=34632 RepID=A0A9D4PHA0_RHISA|nr:hypothetical protein HPB52_023051 [Rhipicephalus sanguineus]
MQRTFIWYARLCRLFGCLYISNINDKTLKTCKASWKSIYTLYALACLAMLVIFEGYSILNKIGCNVGWNCGFGKFLGTISHSVCAFEVFWSIVCLAHGSTRILKFLRGAADFEVSSGFMGPRSTVTLLFYESLTYVSSTCFCEVLLRYLKAQVTALDKLLPAITSRVELRDAAARIETIRVNVCTINELKNIVNEIWCPALVASSGSLVVLTCVAMYRSFTELHPEAMVANSYAAFCLLCFVDMVLLSDDLGGEIRYLHDAVDPDDMCLTAGRFFRLDRPLLVAMAGSVITFTVILVQTSGDLKHTMETKA